MSVISESRRPMQKCHPLKGLDQEIKRLSQALACLAETVSTAAYHATRMSMHPIFRSPGCRTGLLQSSIGIKAGAGILALARGSYKAPENHRYQTRVHRSIQQESACCVSSARLVSARGLDSQQSLIGGRREHVAQSTDLGSRQHFYRAHGPAESNQSISSPRKVFRLVTCRRPRARAYAQAPSSRPRACVGLFCAHRSVSPADNCAWQRPQPR